MAKNTLGYPISNSFIVGTYKHRLVVNISRQSELFQSTALKIETLESFALEL